LLPRAAAPEQDERSPAGEPVLAAAVLYCSYSQSREMTLGCSNWNAESVTFMQIMQKSMLAALLAASGAFPAAAADLPARGYAKAPPLAAPAFSWTGCYLGGNAGGGWGTRTGDRGIINAGNATLNAGTGVPTTLGTGSSGAIGGAQIGCNYQTGAFVVGVETDIQGSGIRGSSTIFTPAIGGADPTTATGTERLDWFGTARARIGFAPTSNLLLYGTGGAAYGGVQNSASLVLTPIGDGNYAGATSQTKVGWTAGAGAEYAFANNWSVKAEYLYLDLGTTGVRMTDPGRPNTFIDYSFRHRDNIVRVGLNYHFGGPVVAKY
jgi:outer membrane immunogenic protein